MKTKGLPWSRPHILTPPELEMEHLLSDAGLNGQVCVGGGEGMNKGTEVRTQK